MEKVKSAMGVISAGAKMFQVLEEDPTLRDALSKLRMTLPMSGLLIERSECWRFKCKVESKFKVIDDLIPQLKDAAYEAQSVLNEFSYQEVKQRAEGIEGRNMSGIVSASLTTIGNWCKDYTTKVNKVLERLVYLNETLEKACDRLGIPQTPNKFSMVARLVTSSMVDELKVYGRDKELDEVVRLLGVPSETNSESPSKKRAKKSKSIDMAESSGIEKEENTYVLPIVGNGGVGKTTLAQMVCNIEKVKFHFDLIIWVCVYDKFDVVSLTKEIKYATIRSYKHINLDSLCSHIKKSSSLSLDQMTLKELLKSKRFLLVLDDVRSESKVDWHGLVGPLQEGSPGSMIIVTTRSLEVAKIAGTVDPIILDGLEESVFWEFLKFSAFGPEVNLGNYPELEEIGKQIVGKLERSPLAAKMLGGLLSTNLNERHWRNIRDSEIWELQHREDGILPVLQLSYQYLPSYLKKCFSFCSLFPKYHRFCEDELIRFWMSEGFIAPQQIRQMEAVAKGYYRELVNRKLFLEIEPNSYRYRFVIHDLMHDVLQSVTKDECLRIESEAFENKTSMDIRHLSVFNEKLNMDELKEICKCKKLYTLKIYNSNICDFNPINSWFNKLTNICSLSLTSSKIMILPDSIGNLNHLRYLNISGTKVEQLPNSFCNLYKLELLDMEYCYHFQCFPEGSNRLISMKLVILPKRYDINYGSMTRVSLVVHIPNFINAIHLEELNFPVSKEGNIIGTLKHINGIYSKMRIQELDNVSTKEEAKQAQLNNKEFLNCLCLSWSRTIITGSVDNNHEAVLAGLCPHPNLKNLEIINYRGEIFHPSWLKTETLTSLTTISIEYCTNVTTIPSLPRSVAKLVVICCESLTSLQDCLVPSNLPSLTSIYISNCDELVSMTVETFHEFAYLQHLTIHYCPKLTWEREMVLPPSLKGLDLMSCGELEERFSSSMQNLTSLTQLMIKNCPRITSIPLENLKSLEILIVVYCSELQSIRGLELLESMKLISIRSCSKLKETNGENLHKDDPERIRSTQRF